MVTQWIGISSDEDQRAKASRHAWMQMRWPLIEMGFSRDDCLRWMKANGFPRPPKSSCIYCPFHGADEWLALSPEELQQAIEVDRRLRAFPRTEYRNRGTLFLHRTCKPLEEIDLESLVVEDLQLDLFDRYECEGMCGV